MIVICQPIYIHAGDRAQTELDRLKQLFSATAVEACEPGPQVDDIFLLGPRNNPAVSRLLKRFAPATESPIHPQSLLWLGGFGCLQKQTHGMLLWFKFIVMSKN